MKVVVLVSGGMDSVTALYHAASEHEVVAGLSFDYGSKHNHGNYRWQPGTVSNWECLTRSCR